nr:type I-B CRISPR-associated protein Cas8b/Csh1 [Clostridium baratii]
MNKPIDSKKIIHSNNYLSFFVKKETLGSKLTEEIIDNYYNTLENPLLKYTKKKAKELYLDLEKELGKVDKEKLTKIKNWIKENIFNLSIDISKKNYLKIFFLYSKDDFYTEGKRYLMPNIYNNNDFNIKSEDLIMGLPNNNMGLNAKKPYLENKTRKTKIPYLIDLEEALLQKKLFDYFLNLASIGKYNLYIGKEIFALKDGEILNEKFNGIYVRLKKGKEAEIQNVDIISDFNPKLNKKFEFKNVLNADYEILYKNKKEDVEEYGIKGKIEELQSLVDIILFNRSLIRNYFSEEISIKDIKLKRALLMSRDKLSEWFYKGNSNNVWNVLNKAIDLVIRDSLEKGYYPKAMNQFNLKYSLKEYLKREEENMADVILNIKDTLRNKVFSKDENKIDSDKEYFFAVGQLTSFLLSKSKGKNKPLSLANPIINAKNDEIIKTKLRQLFVKYNYDMDQDKDLRFKNLYSMIIGYEVEDKINTDLIIAGYLNSNLIYEKKEN